MIAVLEVAVFLIGIHFMMMLLAATYRITDLWYCISNHWQGIAARIVTILVLDAGILWLLGEGTSDAFLWGQVFYLLFHISAFWLVRLGLLIVDLVRR